MIGQHRPKDIIRVLNELQKGKKDIILGVRNFNKKGIPNRSKIGNKISKVLFSAMTGLKITDTQTGLRGYSKDIFDWLLSIPGDRYDFEFNILLGIKENNLQYDEVKIETIYENKNDVSHFRPIKDSILIFKPVCKFIISSILSALIDISLLLIFDKKYNLLTAVILSRIISSMINFFLNKNYVFESDGKENLFKQLAKYYSLVIIIMTFNYLLLKLLHEIFNIYLIIAKIITEIILYIFSFIIQKRVIFKKGKV